MPRLCIIMLPVDDFNFICCIWTNTVAVTAAIVGKFLLVSAIVSTTTPSTLLRFIIYLYRFIGTNIHIVEVPWLRHFFQIYLITVSDFPSRGSHQISNRLFLRT